MKYKYPIKYPLKQKDSLERSTCSGCGRVFKTTHGHLEHRTGDYEKRERRCMTDEEMLAKDMSINKDGLWITETIPQSRIQDRIDGHKRLSGQLRVDN